MAVIFTHKLVFLKLQVGLTMILTDTIPVKLKASTTCTYRLYWTHVILNKHLLTFCFSFQLSIHIIV